jgi:hypothetical protein
VDRTPIRRRRQRSPLARRGPEAPDTPRIVQPHADPGVRIAYVGAQSQAIGEMQVYWQSRGAIFMHCALEANGQPAGLSFVLQHADVVFHSLADVSAETRRYLMEYCERAENPPLPKVPCRPQGRARDLVPAGLALEVLGRVATNVKGGFLPCWRPPPLRRSMGWHGIPPHRLDDLGRAPARNRQATPHSGIREEVVLPVAAARQQDHIGSAVCPIAL